MKYLLFSLLMSFGLFAAPGDLIIHEWGTFTSFVGPDGSLNEGMHEEEEPLPEFVYGYSNRQRDSFFDPSDPCNHPKIPCDTLSELALTNRIASEVMPKNPIGAGITQKMETPVIYFYGDVGQKVKINIAFPTGIISQYYPRAASFSPAYNSITTLGPSSFDFEVELLAKNKVNNLPRTAPHSVWNPSRRVGANTIKYRDEEEKFIFYRGVADFKNKLTVTNKSKKLVLTNMHKKPVTHAFVLNFDGTKGVVSEIGEIKKQKQVLIPSLKNSLPKEQYVSTAKNKIKSALIRSGLFADEALAMVNTWEKSYFHSQGLRILYVLSQEETEEILPLRIDPQPKKLVRTLVGRIEVLTESEVDRLTNIIENDRDFLQRDTERFFEPRLRAVKKSLNKILDPQRRALIASKIDSKLKSMVPTL